MSKLIVVVGATGKQGGSVAHYFASTPGWKVRGITRDPSKPSNAPLREAGIELIAGDLDDPTSLVKAFSGADAVFGVTDFWQFYFLESTARKAEESGKTVPELVCELEGAHGRNIIDAAAKVLQAEGRLERLVLSTLADTRKWTNGEVTGNYHFDAKAAFVNYLMEGTTPALQALKGKTSFVQAGWYMDNWKTPGFKFLEKRDESTLVYRSLGKHLRKAILPMVHPQVDMGPTVKALVEKQPAGVTALATCEEQTTAYWAKALEKRSGMKVEIETLDLDAMKATLGELLAFEMAETSKFVEGWGFDGGDPAVKRPWEIGVERSELMTVERYMNEEDWSSVF